MFIVDMRLRAPYKDFANSWLHSPRADWFNKRMGSHWMKSSQEKNMDLLLEEMQLSNVSYGVVPGRKGGGMTVPNSVLEELHQDYPDKFITLANLDIAEGGIEHSLEEFDQYITNGHSLGACLEQGVQSDGSSYFADDERFWPIYEKCEQNNVPIAFTHSGASYATFDGVAPQHVQNVVNAFPKLKIILMHGGHPYSAQNCGLAFIYENIYLVPDMYLMYSAGWRDYVDASNYILSDQILFGSAYPLYAIDDAVNFNLYKAGFRESVLPKVMGLNAAKLFNIEVK